MFIVLGVVRKKMLLIILSCILVSLPVLSPYIASGYIFITEKIIQILGTWIKNILFTLVFVLVIIPLSVFISKNKKNKHTSFIDTDLRVSKNNFEKMW